MSSRINIDLSASAKQEMADVYTTAGGFIGTQAIVAELLISGFFAVACFRARAGSWSDTKVAPYRLFVLSDRVERMRRTRWQWFAVVLLLVVIRVQLRTPLVVEITGLAQFLVFLLLPSDKRRLEVARLP